MRNGREGRLAIKCTSKIFAQWLMPFSFFFPYLFRIATRSVPRAPYDTLCFVLQNAAGARGGSRTAPSKRRCRAPRASVPSSQAMERRMKEGEGRRMRTAAAACTRKEKEACSQAAMRVPVRSAESAMAMAAKRTRKRQKKKQRQQRLALTGSRGSGGGSNHEEKKRGGGGGGGKKKRGRKELHQRHTWDDILHFVALVELPSSVLGTLFSSSLAGGSSLVNGLVKCLEFLNCK